MNNFAILRPIVKLIWDSENLDSSRCERQRVVGHIEHQPEEHHWDCRNKTTGEKQLTLSSLVFSVFDEYKFCVLLPFLQISLETTLRFFWFDTRLKPRPEAMKVFGFYHLKSPVFPIKFFCLFYFYSNNNNNNPDSRGFPEGKESFVTFVSVIWFQFLF